MNTNNRKKQAMTTESTIPEVPTTTLEPLPLSEIVATCPATYELIIVNGYIPVCEPIQTAPPEPPSQPLGVNVPTVTLGANMPTAPGTTLNYPPGWPCMEDEPCFDCTTMGNLRCGPTPTAITAEVAVAPAQTLPSTGGETVVIGFVAAVILCAGLAFWRVARRRPSGVEQLPV